MQSSCTLWRSCLNMLCNIYDTKEREKVNNCVGRLSYLRTQLWHTYTHTYTYSLTLIHTHMHTHAHTSTHIHSHTHTHTFTHMHAHILTHMHAHTLMQSHAHTHIHTHTHHQKKMSQTKVLKTIKLWRRKKRKQQKISTHTHTHTHTHTYIYIYIWGPPVSANLVGEDLSLQWGFFDIFCWKKVTQQQHTTFSCHFFI